MKTLKTKQYWNEIGMSGLVLAVLGLLIHPYWMPMGVVVILVGLLAVLVFSLGIFSWHESPRDEREASISLQSGRLAFMAGGAILTLGVAVQTLQQQVDPWLVVALAVMILAKISNNLRKQ